MWGPRGASSAAVTAAALLATLLDGCSSTSRVETTQSVVSTPGSSTASAHSASSPSSSDEPAPPYIDHVTWVRDARGRSLHVVPTAAGRDTHAATAMRQAWREVVAKAPTASTATMRAQFDCHWVYARLAEPDKASWNLETWRPVVSDQAMVDSRCNPGGAEE